MAQKLPRLALILTVLLAAPGLFAASKPKSVDKKHKDFSKYIAIPGANLVGNDQCAQCTLIFRRASGGARIRFATSIASSATGRAAFTSRRVATRRNRRTKSSASRTALRRWPTAPA